MHAVENLFAQPYRGWGAAGYNGNSPRDTAPIDAPRTEFGWMAENMPPCIRQSIMKINSFFEGAVTKPEVEKALQQAKGWVKGLIE